MEGPGVKVIAEKLNLIFKGKIILRIWGNSKKIDYSKILGKEIADISSYGKNLLIKIKNNGVIRIHFLMYGSHSVDEMKKEERKVRIAVECDSNKVYFYNCSVNFLKRFKKNAKDILTDDWKPEHAVNKIKKYSGYICDALMDQTVLPGVGNIIKVEALFRAKVHPLSLSSKINAKTLKKLLIETRKFSEEFYFSRKKEKSLRNYLLCYGKKNCINCGVKIERKKMGKLKRNSYFCPNCQVLYQ